MGAYNNTAVALALALCFLCRYSFQSVIGPWSTSDKAVMGDMARAITLPGILESPTSVFYKDGLRVSPNSSLYSVTPVAAGYKVVIRFLSCSDEGRYVLGGERFVVIARPLIPNSNNRVVYYRYTSKTSGNVDKIYTLPVDRKNPYVWNVVWNSTMRQSDKPTDCCPTSQLTEVSAADGADICRMCIYERIGPANETCLQTADSEISDTKSPREDHNWAVPTLETLEYIETKVQFRTASPGLKQLQESLNKMKACCSNAPVAFGGSIHIPLFVTILGFLYA